MIYLQITSSILGDTLSYGPVYTVARRNHVWGYLKEVQDRFNREKGLQDEMRIRLTVTDADQVVGDHFPDDQLKEMGDALLSMLRRQYHERYEEIQNV